MSQRIKQTVFKGFNYLDQIRTASIMKNNSNFHSFLIVGFSFWCCLFHLSCVDESKSKVCIDISSSAIEEQTKIGIKHHKRGDFDLALDVFNNVKDSIDMSCNQIASDALFAMMGDTHFQLREYDFAIQQAKRAITLNGRKSSQDSILLSNSHNNLGAAQIRLGQLKEGLTNLIRGLKIRESLQERLKSNTLEESIIRSMYNLGQSFQENQQYNSALYYQKKAIGKFKNLDSQSSSIGFHCYNSLGLTYQKMGLADSALLNYDQAEEYAKQREKKMAFAIVSNNRGFVHYRAKQNYQQSLDQFQLALSLLCPGYEASDVFRNPDLSDLSSHRQLISLKGKGISLHSLGKTKSAIRYLDASLETFKLAQSLIKKIRLGYVSEGDKVKLAEDTPPIFEEAIAVSHTLFDLTGDQQYLETAFQFIQASKSASLFEQQQDSYAKKFAKVPSSKLKEEREIRKRLLAKSGSNSEYAEELQLFETFRNGIEDVFPEYHALKYGFEYPTLGEVQNSSLNEHTAIIEYFVGDSTLFIMAITEDSVKLEPYLIDSGFADSVKIFRNAIIAYKDQQKVSFDTLGYTLFRRLIYPLQETIAGKSLLIMPDGILHHLPFDALLTRMPTSSMNRQSYPYLIASHSISYAHSSALLFLNLEKEAKQPPADKDLLTMAPIFPGKPLGIPSSSSYFRLDAVNKLTSLEKTANNLHKITEELDGTFRGQKKASKQYFLSEAESYDILLIGTHGIMNDQNPMRSFLAFSFDTTSSENASLLYTSDVYGLNLNARLAILNACHSGEGFIQRGEGSISMARAFAYAGCPSLVMSLWESNEDANNRLVSSFMRKVYAGKSKRTALHEAKLELLADPDYCHPYMWSSMIMIGNPGSLF